MLYYRPQRFYLLLTLLIDIFFFANKILAISFILKDTFNNLFLLFIIFSTLRKTIFSAELNHSGMKTLLWDNPTITSF